MSEYHSSELDVRNQLARAHPNFVMNTAEARLYLGFAQTHFHNLVKQGAIKSFQPNGRRRMYYKKDLDAYIQREAS